MTKTIVWLGEEKRMTKWGMMHEGRVVELPKHIADSYIEQGLAKEESDADEIEIRTEEG